MQIGRKIAEIRHEKGLTQKQLAERTGVTIPWVSRVETKGANLTIATMVSIANALEVEPRTLWIAPHRLAKPSRGRPLGS